MKQLRWVFLFGLIAAFGLCAGADEPLPAVNTLEQLVSKWVELSKELGREEETWREQKDALKQERQLLLKEKELLENEIAAAREKQTSAEKERAHLLRDEKEMKEALSACLPAISRAEAELKRLAALVPSKLGGALKKGLDRLASSSQAVSRRLRIIVGLYKEIERLENQVHLVRETLEVERGVFREMDVIYLGLSQGYAVSLDDEVAGIGRPCAGGWGWQWHPELSAGIRSAISCYRREASPDFSYLPLKIVDVKIE